MKLWLAVLKGPPPAASGHIHQEKKRVEVGGGTKWTENSFRGQGISGDLAFYHLRVTVTVGLEEGSWGRQGGGQRAGVCGDVVLVVVIRLGGALRVTAGEEVGARPGHSSFLFGAGPAHLLPGNHMNRSAVCVFVRICQRGY